MIARFSREFVAIRSRAIGTFLTVLTAMFVIAVPALAGDCCPSVTPETVKTLSDHDIRALQLCLVDGGFYDAGQNDHIQIDGIVGTRTLNALARAQKSCGASPGPSPDIPKPPPYVPASCEDGGQIVSYVLTQADLDALKALAAQPPTPDADPPNPPDPKLTPEFVSRLGMLQDAEYPSRELFENAVSYFTKPLGTTGQIRTVAQKACKVRIATDTAQGWVAESDVPMVYDLSHASYGFYPFWLGSETPADPKVARKDIVHVDFSVLTRIEWFGVTFSDDGKLNLSPFMHQPGSTVFQKTKLARNFNTDVDLVVYHRESDWQRVVSGEPDSPGQLTRAEFIDRLAANIADEVSTPLTGFLDGLQNWFPAAFRTSPTFWNGATLYFDRYPFNDPDAMQFLVDLLRATRSKLSAREYWANFPKTTKRHLALNVVIPFCSIVSNESCPASQAGSGGVTMKYLRQLVPKTLGDSRDVDDAVDSFIVFLPESTSVNKMALRGQIEKDFSSDADKASMQKDEGESLAAWRAQMLRKISYVLFPATAKWKMGSAASGAQFYDDVVYAQDNFQGIGLWPLPTYGASNKPVAADIRGVFDMKPSDWMQSRLAPLFGARIPDFFITNRRWLFLLVAVLILLLAIYAVCAFWIIELREFWKSHFLWCMSPIAVIVAILGFEFLFDRDLSPQFTPFLVVLFVVGIGGWMVRRTFLSKLEKDLP